MFDELERLRSVKELFALLDHYGRLAAATGAETWQDRLEQLEDTNPRELVRLHGELLAYGWLEQNTGATPVLRAGAAPACYRLTSAGKKALQQARTASLQPA
jgi:hypothetical protein